MLIFSQEVWIKHQFNTGRLHRRSWLLGVYSPGLPLKTLERDEAHHGDLAVIGCRAGLRCTSQPLRKEKNGRRGGSFQHHGRFLPCAFKSIP